MPTMLMPRHLACQVKTQPDTFFFLFLPSRHLARQVKTQPDTFSSCTFSSFSTPRIPFVPYIRTDKIRRTSTHETLPNYWHREIDAMTASPMSFDDDGNLNVVTCSTIA